MRVRRLVRTWCDGVVAGRCANVLGSLVAVRTSIDAHGSRGAGTGVRSLAASLVAYILTCNWPDELSELHTFQSLLTGRCQENSDNNNHHHNHNNPAYNVLYSFPISQEVPVNLYLFS